MSNIETVEIIGQQLEDYEKEFLNQNESMGNRIKEFAINESSYQIQISNLINQLNRMKKENILINSNSNSIQCQYNSLKCEYERIIECFNSIQKSYEDLRIKYKQMEDETKILNNKYNNISLDLKDKESEIENLNNLLNQSNIDYQILNEKFNILKNDKENKSLNSNIFHSRLNDLNNQNSILQSENKQLNVNLNMTNEKYEDLDSKFSDLYSKYNQLSKEKYLIEQQNTKIQIENDKLKKEIEKLKDSKIELDNYKESYDNNTYNNNEDLNKMKNELNNISSFSNENVNAIVNWIDSYLPNVYSHNITLPQINLYSNDINFELIKNSLIKNKQLIDNKFYDLNNEIKGLKKTLLNCQDSNYKITKNLEDIYQLLIEEIEKGKYFNLNKFKVENDLYNNIEDMLNKIFSLLKRIKLTKEEKYVDKLIDDNCILNNNNQELCIKVENLLNENCILNQKIKDISEKATLNFSLENDNRKLIKDNVTLIKKVKELKDQITTLTTPKSTP